MRHIDYPAGLCLNLAMRFLGLIFGLGLFSAVVYGMFFVWGHTRQFVAFENEFLKQPTPWVFLPAELNPEKNEIPWLEIEQAQDGLLKVKATGEALPAWISKNKPSFLVLSVLNSKSEIHEQISSLVPTGMEEKILVQSEIDVVLASLKTLRARWAYGTSIADQVRWKSFDSLGLVSAVSFVRDVYVTPLTGRHGDKLSSSIVNEVRRRGLKLVIGPLSSESEVQEAKEFKPDGYFILKSDLRSQIN